VKRATFTIPDDELDVIEQLRLRISCSGELLNRSEVVRAGLLALEALSDRGLSVAAKKVRKLKPGRTGGDRTPG
jgi:hypothetical protein